MRAQKMSITELVLQKSHEYTRYFRNAALDAAIKRNFDLQVKASLAQQKQLEATDEIPFDQYLSNYFSQNTSARLLDEFRKPMQTTQAPARNGHVESHSR